MTNQDVFSKEQLFQAFAKVQSGADFPQLVQDLKSMGVTHFDNKVEDGSCVYFGANGFSLALDPMYPAKNIADEGSTEMLKQALRIHQEGQTDYPTFCTQAAEAGVDKWITDMFLMTVCYLDKKGKIVSVEAIPLPKA